MGSFTYTTGIPNGSNAPSNDQPSMQTNTNSISSLIAIDHVGFNDAGSQGGWHQQIHFNTNNAQGAQTDPASVLYTAAGTASTVANLTYKNQNATFPLSFMRAMAICDSGGNILNSQSFNVTSVTANSTGNFTVVMPANTVNSTTYGVLVSVSGQNLTVQYAITNATTFTLAFRAPAGGALNPTQFTFLVIQL